MIANNVYINLPPDTLAMLVVDFEEATEQGARHLGEELAAARHMLVALIGRAEAAELVESVRVERPRIKPVGIVLHGFEDDAKSPAWVSTLREFFANNEALDEDDKDAIGDLGVGESHEVGGGASPLVRIERAA